MPYIIMYIHYIYVGFNTYDTGKNCFEAAYRHVSSNCSRNGIPSKDENGAQRSGSKKLHVSFVYYTASSVHTCSRLVLPEHAME